MGLLLAACCAFAGCSGDHDFLAQKGGGKGGSPDGAPIVDVGVDERRPARPTDAADAPFEASLPDVIDEPLPPEPPGRFSFTWTNGLVDAESARFCFVPVVKGQELRDQVAPLPGAGLAFGRSMILGELRGIDLSTMDVRPYAVVGEGAGSEAGLGCGMLDMLDGAAGNDGARGPIAVALPLIPAGTLAEARSYLGVATGCARPWPFSETEAGVDGGDAGEDAPSRDDGGDATHDAIDANTEADVARDVADASADNADGARDAPAEVEAGSVDGSPIDVFRPPVRAAICGPQAGPGAGLVLVRLSQRDVGTRMGLQVVHASVATSSARIAVVRTPGALPFFSTDLGPNQISPRDTPVAVDKSEFGSTLGAGRVEIGSPVAAFAPVAVSLATAFTSSGIDETALREGDAFSLVLIGAQPGQDPGPPWNTARFAVVKNAPLSGGD